MRNKRRVTALVVIATAAAIAAGGLMASNMGFKLNFPLQETQAGVSKTGRNTIGLPYNRQVGIDTASQLLGDVVAGGISGIQLEQFNKQFDTNEPYPGPAGDFGLVASEAYLLRVTNSGDYIIVGSHDPGLSVTLLATAPGVSKTGRTRYAHPYHGVASTASELLAELGPSAIQVEDFNIQFDTNEPYPGPAGDFGLVPGKGYLVRVVGDLTFTPAHY
jgi:hypothetical protein